MDFKTAAVFDGVSKEFDHKPVLQDVSFVLPSGKTTALLGPSGAGKSTILKLIAGLIRPDAGQVKVEENPVSFVFDESYLFDSMSCLENIAYGLPWKKGQKPEIFKQAQYWGNIFECGQFLNQKAGTLSAGQKQRTALARAFLKDPQILLLDEPFSRLDVILKQELMRRILDLQKQKGFTMVFVTHSFAEAFELADQVLVVQNGRVLEQGSPLNAMDNPLSLYAAGALQIPQLNWLPADVVDHGKSGMAAVYAFDLHTHDFPGAVQIPARFQSEMKLGALSLQIWLSGETVLTVLQGSDSDTDKKTGLYVSPEKILYFDASGSRIYS